ncbi:MAG: winged helix-turn-helix domain-containing protein [Candidatus Bathyarchaeales archaeon]
MSDKNYAEIFDALAHPTRISILKALQEENLTFADLKRKMRIESSGHLQHHLSKLGYLIKTDEYGKYCLSEHGKDALFVVQTVEREAKSGESGVHVNGFRKRVILNSIIVLLAITSLVSSLYLWNFVAAQGQYSYDVVKGSPLREDASLWMSTSIFEEIMPGQSFNFTAMVFSELNPQNVSYACRDYGTFYASLPTITDAYYRVDFLGFRFIITTDTHGIAYFTVSGPEGAPVKDATNPYEAPPYKTEIVRPFTMGFSSGSELTHEYHIPVEVFGNYTFQIVNIGNATIRMRYEAWTSTVTMENRPLNGTESFPAVITSGSEKVVRVIWQSKPANTPLTTIAITICCSTALAMLGIYLTNRKLYIRKA